MSFEELRLIEPLLRAVRSEGYTQPTLVQEKAIGPALDGSDVLACAQTGTGKTAAFSLPILQRLHTHPRQDRSKRTIRALILTPTRELAAQVSESIQTYGKHVGLRHAVVIGGVSQHPQVQKLRQGVDILVATPGRLVDLFQQRVLTLSDVEILVLDEADRMLDMGFLPAIRKVLAQLPKKRQNLLFSATMPPEIRELANTILRSPVTIQVAPRNSAPAEGVVQTFYRVDQRAKTALLQHLLNDPQVTRALVFTRTKWRADQVAKSLSRSDIATEAIHSNKSQNARQRTLAKFKNGDSRVLVASDIASRGIDIDQISHVFNFDLPDEAETYVHRIGRTGRAGASGHAISFCSDDQRKSLKGIERLLGGAVQVQSHPQGVAPAGEPHADGERPARPQQQQHRNGGGHRFAKRGGSGGGGGKRSRPRRGRG